MRISEYELRRLHFRWDLPIGDSQVRFDDMWLTLVELRTDTGHTGLGFGGQQGNPTPPLSNLKAQFEYAPWPALKDANPISLAMRIRRPRGGNVGANPFGAAVEIALWDLAAQAAELPLYRLLGGSDPRVRAYGSTLDFRLTDEQFRQKLEWFHDQGFRAIKIKVGHPDLEWDLRRLGIAQSVMGEGADLMVDANEAWSPKEAVLRARAYRQAGFDIYWIEDPITRDDYAGYRFLCQELPFTRINTGEYLSFAGKLRLLENRAVDVLNVHADFSGNRTLARVAGDYGVPLSLGNTPLEVGVHLAASLPECLYLEFSNLGWNQILREPVRFEDGYALAPDRPGHGLQLDPKALVEYSAPD